ncbi:Solute carrier family 35 member E1 like [Dissostichus eleginoides]|uniref:Solute carrier family 35 member E1 like n=1 Tax=Dissostichus eleginoides TaxID=100907 RepID=A0AAD9B8P2_DISEL|nr:Solute carrier family 35 member E1 like [Dissostichus eleginoides]
MFCSVKSDCIITPESGSEVLCLLSRSGLARFLRPVGADHRVCALTDGERHTDDPLSTCHRKAQPLSPEADPFFQGETLGDGSKGCRNYLEWRSRELAKQEVRLLSRSDSPS